MYIKEIIRFHEDDNEADICVSDDTYQVLCYACPVSSVEINQKVNVIYGFSCAGIVKESTHNCLITKLSMYYAYSITAEVISRNGRLVQIGRIIIQLDTPIPADIKDGDYVSFSVQRLDF